MGYVSVEPIRDVNNIKKVSEYFISNHDYTSNLIFVIGTNLGLSYEKLYELKVHEVMDNEFNVRDTLEITEEDAKFKRICYLNESIKDALRMYFRHNPTMKRNEYLFVDNDNYTFFFFLFVEKIGKVLNMKVSECTMQRTFFYQTIMNAMDKKRAIKFLQKAFGYSSPINILAIAGFSGDELNNLRREHIIDRYYKEKRFHLYYFIPRFFYQIQENFKRYHSRRNQRARNTSEL